MTYAEFKEKFLPQFLNIKSFRSKIEYANQYLQKIGSGTGRIVYDIDGQKVLKLAKNAKGIAQNEAEAGAGYYRDTQNIVTIVFDSADDDNWLVAEKAKKINEARIKQLTGIPSLNDLLHYVKNFDSENHGRGTIFSQEPEVKEQLQENEWVIELVDFIANYGQHPGDYGRPSSFGEVLRDGQPTIVLTDYGLNDEVYNTHYSPERKNKSQYRMYELYNAGDGNDDMLSDIGNVGNEVRHGMWAVMPYDVSDGDGVINEDFISFVLNRDKYPTRVLPSAPYLLDEFHNCVNNLKETLDHVDNKKKFYNNLLTLQEYLISQHLYDREPLGKEEYELDAISLPEGEEMLSELTSGVEGFERKTADEIANKIVQLNNYKQVNYYGKGTYGYAYDIGDNKIMKITSDKSEAIESQKIKGKNLKHLADIYDVYQIKPKEGSIIPESYVIIMEKLKINQLYFDRMTVRLDYAFENILGIDFNHIIDDYISGEYEDKGYIIDKYLTKNLEDSKFYYGLLGIADEARQYGIESMDYINTSNLGYKKNGNLGFFDMGFGDLESTPFNKTDKIEMEEDGSSKFSTDDAIGQEEFPIYNQHDTSPSIDNNIQTSVDEDLEYNHVVGDATEDQYELDERKLSFMDGSSTVEVKKKCRLAGNGNTSTACNQGDIKNLKIKPLEEEITKMIYEEINASDAIKNPIKTILSGKRDVAFVDLDRRNATKLEKQKIGVIPVRMTSQNTMMAIIYHDKIKALKLYEIVKRNGGYLSDKSEAEAREIGQLLGYNEPSIAEYIRRKYGSKIPVMPEKFPDDYDDLAEDVADTYGQQKFGFELPHKGFEDKFNREEKEDVVFVSPVSDLAIIRNPKSLNDIGAGVRGVIDPEGNLYTEQQSTGIHFDILYELNKLGLVEDVDNWDVKLPTNFVTVQRYKKTNKYCLGESNYSMSQNMLRRSGSAYWEKMPTLEQATPVYQRFLDRAKQKNPHIEFINEPIGYYYGNGTENNDIFEVENTNEDYFENLTGINTDKKVHSMMYEAEVESCKSIRTTSEIQDYLMEFDSDEELLRSGGIPTDMLDRAAFGFDDSLKQLMPKQLSIKWNDDLENVKWEIKKKGLTDVQFAKNVNLVEPIDVSFDGKSFNIEDGHHRYYAASVLNKPLNVNLEIKANPITALGGDMGYDDFHRCIWKQVHGQTNNILNEAQIMPLQNLPFIQEVEKVGGKIYSVGGAVRDEFLGKESKDLDILITGVPFEQLEQILGKYGVVNAVGKSFGVLKFKPKDATEDIDIAIPRTEKATGEGGHQGFDVSSDHALPIEKDLERRDFTINAIAKDAEGNIVDPFGGQEDLKNKIIRIVNPEAFSDDPLRMLRAVQFASRFGFTIEPNTMKIIQENAGKVQEIAPERILTEFDKIIKKGNKLTGALLLRDTGLLREIFGNDAGGLDVGRNIWENLKTMGEFVYLLSKNLVNNPAEFYKNNLKGDVPTYREIKAYELAFDNGEATNLIEGRSIAHNMYLFSPQALQSQILPNIIKTAAQELLQGKYPKIVNELAVNGNDLISVGLKGEAVGNMQRSLLLKVYANKVRNNKEELLNLVNQNNNEVKEGVADTYAEKQFNIPNIPAKNNVQAMAGMQKGIESPVGYVIPYASQKRVPIYLNPKSLTNFDNDVRAIVNYKGDLYVAQESGRFNHGEMAKALGLFGDDEELYNHSDEYQGLHRIGNTNGFGLSDSGSDYVRQNDENLENIKDLLREVQRKNPQYKFYAEYYDEVKYNDEIDDNLDEFAFPEFPEPKNTWDINGEQVGIPFFVEKYDIWNQNGYSDPSERSVLEFLQNNYEDFTHDENLKKELLRALTDRNVLDETVLNEMSIQAINYNDIITPEYIKQVEMSDNYERYIEYYQYEENMVDVDKEEIEKTEEFKSWFKYELRARYDDAVDNITTKIKPDDTIDIWRRIKVDDIWTNHLLQAGKHLGIYWSWDERAAEAHWGDTAKNSNALIKSSINEKYIDWRNTIYANMDLSLGEDEKEITLFKNTSLKIEELNIDGQDVEDVMGSDYELQLRNKTFYA